MPEEVAHVIGDGRRSSAHQMEEEEAEELSLMNDDVIVNDDVIDQIGAEATSRLLLTGSLIHQRISLSMP